jgi:hypothetical protein
MSKATITKIQMGNQPIATSKPKIAKPVNIMNMGKELLLAFKVRMKTGKATTINNMQLATKPPTKELTPNCVAMPFWMS